MQDCKGLRVTCRVETTSRRLACFLYTVCETEIINAGLQRAESNL